MKKSYTLFYLLNDLENPSFELISADLFGSPYELDYQDVFKYLDNQHVEINNRVVEKLIHFAGEILNSK